MYLLIAFQVYVFFMTAQQLGVPCMHLHGGWKFAVTVTIDPCNPVVEC